LRDSVFRSLIEHTTDLVSILDANGTVMYASPSHVRVLGYQPRDLVGRNAFELVHPDDLAGVAERFQAGVAGQGAVGSGQFRYRCADGGWRPVESVGVNQLDDPAIRGIVINTRDVTERVATEEALRKNEKLLAERLAELELVYRTAPVGLALMDEDLRYVRVNDVLAAMNGRPAKDHSGRSLHEVIPQIADRLVPIHRRVIETGEAVLNLDFHGASPADPTAERDWLVSYYPWKEATGRVVGVSVAVQDITARKQAENALQRARDELEAKVRERTADLVRANDAMRIEIDQRREAEESLRRSEEKYRELVERIDEVIFTVDDAGRITYISPAIESITGYAPAEVIGHFFTRYVHPDDRAALQASFVETIGGKLETSEYRVIDKEGNVHWFRSRSQVVVQGGRTVGLRGLLTDITEQRRAEEELQKRQAEIAHAQRLNIAGEMTAELAHEINQPLCAIANFADGMAARLRDRNVDLDAMREIAEHIATQARRGGEVLRRLREFLRKGETMQERYDVNRLLHEVSRLLEPEFRRHSITLRLRLDPTLPDIDLDRIQIEQVVLNLARNAIEAMTERDDCDRLLDIRSAATGSGMAVVTFEDTGVGIPEGAEEEIFDAFFTTKREGLGMGLSVSRSIIEGSGGRLWAVRNPVRGSTVAFSLPLPAAKRLLR
jgi:PAS domain S-box-containing protein